VAWVYLKLKDMPRAIETYQKIANNTRYHYDSRKNAQYQVGKIYETQQNYARAIEAYKRLVEEFPKPISTPDAEADKIDKAYIINLQQKIPAQPTASI